MKLRVYPKRVDVIALWNVKIRREEDRCCRHGTHPADNSLLTTLKDELRMIEAHVPDEVAMEIEE